MIKSFKLCISELYIKVKQSFFYITLHADYELLDNYIKRTQIKNKLPSYTYTHNGDGIL